MTDSQPGLTSEPTPNAPSARKRSVLREVVETVLLAFLLFVLVRSVVHGYQVDGASMMPSFQNGERVLANRNAYRSLDAWDLIDWIPGMDERNRGTIVDFGKPERGDVIIFTPPALGQDKPYIKRVIGIPGDEVVVLEDAVYINGVHLDEPYIDSRNRCDTGWHYCDGVPVVVPEGSVYVMGDNRTNSEDSRFFGVVPEENIIGKAWVVYWPTSSWGIVDHMDYPALRP